MSEGKNPESEMDFINKSGLEFNDISAETEREYKFASGASVKVTNPLKLNVSKSGGHRLFDADGNSHYVPAGWVHLRWSVKDGGANFDL